MSKLVEETPNVAMMIFDLCVYQDKYFTHRSYGETMVGTRVSYSFFPFKKGKDREYYREQRCSSHWSMQALNLVG